MSHTPVRISACLAAALLVVLTAPLSAQESSVERKAQGLPDKDIQIGVYLNVQSDCTSGTLPALRLVSPPQNGKVSIKQGKVTATNYKQCLALQVPGFIAFYRSKPDFTGQDRMTIEVKYPGGRTEVQTITVTVGDGQAGRRV